jgi:hypothetical protein
MVGYDWKKFIWMSDGGDQMRNLDTREGQHHQLLTFNFDENIGFLRDVLAVEQSFDVIHRKLESHLTGKHFWIS